MRYVIGFLIAVGLIILTFIILFKVFRGSPTTPQAPLTGYAETSTTMQWTIDGPETANMTHRSIQIIVGRDQATINVYQGYQNNLINTKSYVNNADAYGVFLRGLDRAGYTKGDKNASQDYRGFCAEGRRYIYEVVDPNGNDTQKFWSTSCAGQGTFHGNFALVSWLFENQIPDFGQVTTNVAY